MKKVSVCVVTYNHEKFLAEALDSILMQELDNPMEIVLGEDCSTDNTLEICKAYEQKYPGIVKLYVNDRNKGYNWNFYHTMRRCTGDYIAVLDGDDLWTDPLKLKKQLKFLDEHPEYILSFSKYYVCDEDSNLGEIKGFSGAYNLNDVLSGRCPGTRTVVYRKECLPSVMPDEYEKVTYADHLLLALIVQCGPMYGLAEPLAAYRMNPKSIYASNTLETRAMNSISNYELMKNVFPAKEQHKAIDTGINNERIRLERSYFFLGQFIKLMENSFKLLVYDLRNAKFSFMQSWWIISKASIKLLVGKISLKQARA